MPGRRWTEPLLGGIGATLLIAMFASYSEAASASATQVWPAFVLVTGLLLVGMVAADDQLFAAAGERLGRSASRSWVLFAGMCALIVAVTAVLNLDTAVTFLTPVAAYTCKARKQDPVYLLAACLLLSNAGSLPLPGSNLTNVIVLGDLHLTGQTFLAHMGLVWVAAVLTSVVVIGLLCRRSLAARIVTDAGATIPRLGLGLISIVSVSVLVLAVRTPAVPVLAVGVVAAGLRLAQRRIRLDAVRHIVGLPVLIFLFGLAVTAGTVGRKWSGPVHLLRHLDPAATAGVAAGASVLLNNLPAAALLSARPPLHPFSMLVGLDIGPNLFFTGSLAWLLWIGACRNAGADPPLRQTLLMGLASAPLALAVSVGALYLTGGVS